MEPPKLRKNPKQIRSKLMVDNILESAIRVLKESPYEKFTTNRVAEAAGISVGSLYQYFSNKQAILLELETKAVNQMTENVEKLLFDERHTSQDRLFNAIKYFFVTESSFYDMPFTSNLEFSAQLKKLEKTVDCFLKSNQYTDESSDDFLAGYLVVLLSGVAEQVATRKDIKDLDSWILATFDTVMKIIDKKY